MSTNGQTAIWYINEWNQWAIGKSEDIGSKVRGIRSSLDANCPGIVGDGNWDYSNQSIWYNGATDIQVKCSGKLISYYRGSTRLLGIRWVTRGSTGN